METKDTKKTRYMRCEHCGKLIKEGSNIVVDTMRIGAYCNALCWAYAIGQFKETVLTDEEVKDNWGLNKWDVEE